jgi:hypothetical protein
VVGFVPKSGPPPPISARDIEARRRMMQRERAAA